MKRWMILLIVLLLIPVVGATEYSLPLLAVRGEGAQAEGITATLTLEVIPGKGRVFLETKPFTKIDTQISMRFAQNIACAHLEKDCSNVDFIYTIESASEIVGGPSAGAPAAVLTVLALEQKAYDRTIALTGTINSGGIIGPVGGIPEKAAAGFASGMNKVLVPLGDETGNVSGHVVVVGTLQEAIAQFTHETYEEEHIPVVEDEAYNQLMSSIAEGLCARSDDLTNSFDDLPNGVTNLTQKANASFHQGDYYSAASRCFTANVRLRELKFDNLSVEALEEGIAHLHLELNQFTKELDEKALSTLPTLQTYMIVHERLRDAHALLATANNSLVRNNTEDARRRYAYATERFASALSWSTFFAKEGKQFDEQQIPLACRQKLAEAQERVQYLITLYPQHIGTLHEDLRKTITMHEQKEYATCLYSASLIKARADTIIGGAGITSEETLQELIQLKLSVADKHVAQEQARGFFPIAGYAYRDYADSLKEDDPGSALLYAQYALELSTFDLYFDHEEDVVLLDDGYKPLELAFLYGIGLLSGMLIILGIKRL